MITGDIQLFLDALDRAWDDPAVRDVVARLGVHTVTETEADTVAVRQARFTEAGVVMTFRSDRLDSIVFTIDSSTRAAPGALPAVGRRRRASYPIDTLVDGITRDSTRADVRSLLGTPLRTWWAIDEYLVGERVLSVTFHGRDFDEFQQLGLLREDPVVLRYDDIPWSPVAQRRDGRIFLEVPVSLGVADTLWGFEITAEQVAALTDRKRFELLTSRLHGRTDRDQMRTIIDATCSG